MLDIIRGLIMKCLVGCVSHSVGLISVWSKLSVTSRWELSWKCRIEDIFESHFVLNSFAVVIVQVLVCIQNVLFAVLHFNV